MPRVPPLYPHAPKSRGPLVPSLKDKPGDREGAIEIYFEELRREGYELRTIIRAGERYIVTQSAGIEPALPKAALYYYDVTDIVHLIYRPPVGMNEYCAVKVWPKPTLIMSIKGVPLKVETLSDLWVYFQLSFGFHGDLITPDTSYIRR